MIHPINYAHGFRVIWYGFDVVYHSFITHIVQGYLLAVGPVSVKQTWRMWVNDAYEYTRNCDRTKTKLNVRDIDLILSEYSGLTSSGLFY